MIHTESGRLWGSFLLQIEAELSGGMQTCVFFQPKALKGSGYSGIIIQLCIRAFRKLPRRWSHVYGKGVL